MAQPGYAQSIGAGIVTTSNAPIGPDGVFPNAFAYSGGDPKQQNEQRLARMKAILAAHPDATARLNAMDSRQARTAYIRQLDRQTPGYAGGR
ncbi:hypothetical protein [Sphingomonas sp.]|uniref:hypothetical protein n=1 Tax=Sphingomonas sp. TaxID=28214 RepID=UPI002CA0648F|nr:hypothetical protein [Sphingomonas sp.]HTG37325.1 hypothetical protein [Sphingomonas sp.]